MSRKNRAPKRILYSDSRYQSLILSKFINIIMLDGKKTTAEKIVYTTFDQIKNKTKEDPIKVFNDAINNVRPNLEVRSRRVGGATYQVPVEIRPKRRVALAHRWIVEAARSRKGETITNALYSELSNAVNNTGIAIKKKEDSHRMAEANRAFAHYRW